MVLKIPFLPLFKRFFSKKRHSTATSLIQEVARIPYATEWELYYPGGRIPPFSPMYDVAHGSGVLYEAPPSISDMQVLRRFDTNYQQWVHKHNSALHSPELSLNLGDAYSLIWRYYGWEDKISKLLHRERIAISPNWTPILPRIPELCYWVAPPGLLTTNCDASLASRAIGVSFRTPRGELLGNLIHQSLPDDVCTVEGAEVFAMLKALEASRQLLRGFEDSHECKKGLLLLNDNMHMVRKLVCGEFMKGSTPTALLVNGLLQKARNVIADIERDKTVVTILYVRRESNRLADFVSAFDVSGSDQGSFLSAEYSGDSETECIPSLLSEILSEDAQGEFLFRKGTIDEIREEGFTPKKEKLSKRKT
ncbi:unnamed protein product [Cuscuta campestris]|uniref:Uncharacterized protein n=1 Tax=Cuscuta campestris TaxID=132261 RepID=A0A484M7M7_9ASTE|nr:unnamed protein product [Cuscuta campestris]